MKSVANHYIAKIEGHGSLNINFAENTAELNVHEGERLFEDILIGRRFEDGVFIPQRICGVCPTAHCIATIKALEDAFKVAPSETTRDFRKLMLAGQIIQSHALHLFFLTLPDYLKVDGALALAKSDPEKFRLALNLKEIGDRVITVVGGRPVHPITPMVGGFSRLPGLGEVKRLRDELQMNFESGRAVVELFASLKYPKFAPENEYLSIQSDRKYGFYGGLVASSSGEVFEIRDYRSHIEETSRTYSTAKFGSHHGRPFMVGALARVNMHREYLNPLTLEAMDGCGVEFPTDNSFKNNLAQAVEILHFLEEAVGICDKILDNGIGEHRQQVEPRAGRGVGATEAPRGTLYYTYDLDDEGRIRYCDIVTPTVQNLGNMEANAAVLLKSTSGSGEAKRRRLLDMLIRAYDPCITCSVH